MINGTAEKRKTLYFGTSANVSPFFLVFLPFLVTKIIKLVKFESPLYFNKPSKLVNQ